MARRKEVNIFGTASVMGGWGFRNYIEDYEITQKHGKYSPKISGAFSISPHSHHEGGNY